MDGLIIIRSITLSNHIARHGNLRESWQDYHWALRGVAEITLSHLRKEDGYKRASVAQRKKRAATRLAFREHRRQS